MNTHSVELMAGFTSSMIFVTGNLPMLYKAFKTRDLRSYSLLQLILGNVGNTVYWFYVISLPLGPIWYLQAFFSTSSALMLFCYLRYEKLRLRAGQAKQPGLDPDLPPMPESIPASGSSCKPFQYPSSGTW